MRDLGAGDEEHVLRDGSSTRKAEEMVRTIITTIWSMPLRNRTGDILLGGKQGVISSLFTINQQKKRKKPQRNCNKKKPNQKNQNKPP